MKALLIVGLGLFSVSSFALSAFPDGKWEGKGNFANEAGMKGEYSEKLTIEKNVLTAELETQGKKATYILRTDFRANDFFSLTIEDKTKGEVTKGSGYCGSMWCHLEDDSHKFEMTLVFKDKDIYELGSDVEGGKRGRFESALIQK